MKVPVIIDTNLTEDFALGLMAAVQSDQLDTLATTVTFGETSVDCAAANTTGLLNLLGRKIPVAQGAEKPWRRDYTMPLKEMFLNQEINGLQIETDRADGILEEFAPDFQYRLMKECGQKVTLLCAGPLTNIAYLLERHPDALEYIDQLIWRGGTQRHAVMDVVKDMQTYQDPDAAARVLSSGMKIVLCPVDMGFSFYASQEEIDRGMGFQDTARHQYNRLLKKRWCEVNAELPMGCRTRPLPLQELASVFYLTNPELFSERRIYGEVDLKGKLTFGMLVIDIKNRLEKKPEEWNLLWLNGVDREAAVQHLYWEDESK